MARLNDEVGALLREYADLILLSGGNAFRARSYEKAARSVGGYPGDLAHLDEAGLRAIPGVGDSTAEKISEYLASGRMEALESLRAKIPPGVREVTQIPGVGPKTAVLLYRKLGIKSVDELRKAADAGKLKGLPGLGEKTVENIRHGIEQLSQASGRTLLSIALDLAEDLVAELGAVPGCKKCDYAGSLRRMRETVGDIDILATAKDSAPLMAALLARPEVADVIGSGTTKTSIRTDKGLQVDLRVVQPAEWGAALVYFTGSRAHNIKLRGRAVKEGLKLSEYGLFDVESGKKLASRTEKEVYAALGLPWIPPTLREDRGEIEAAADGALPDLVQLKDLRGDLHTHTDLTDGLAPLEVMLQTAADLGYAYYAVTDHAPNLAMQRMTDDKMLAQRARARDLDREYSGMRVLHGTELNIDAAGDVDWPADFLAGFDLCVASIHSSFGLDRAAQTKRLIRACENPHVNIIGHPTTRLLDRRPPIDADLDAVFAAAAHTGTALELNASPQRLDLTDDQAMAAQRHGVKFAINSDAHSTPALSNRRFGIATAQRAWLTKDDVINTWSLTRLRAFLRKPAVRGGGG
ncbi:PHP domain protein [Catenulispora acidiphila DSM 44928]|uniref:DNA polymerase beta n=1 Tax=Catenulispora acidiphila (strain DSM 44928 / JCM 14897 / NBRC 102108 / NRRL B-24433 / ID139908) TaxID=479433 RepID=C7PW28_CATAD|nr:DNA polymerase/3'-5' exonuclease PolX [Catenulispora acidiphila]ACU73276.1 PHP domain protein [Catenulispora acidiphila DSM 44928]